MSNKSTFIITIDGPAGVGKSTVGKIVAKRLHFHYLDSGAIYRALTLKAITKKVNLADRNALIRLAKRTRIKFRQTDSGTRVYLDNRNVTKLIRRPELTAQVYQLANLAGVRKEVNRIQQSIVSGKKYVVEGRDTGSVVFPDAPVKFYLDASHAERALRRHRELEILQDRDEKQRHHSAPMSPDGHRGEAGHPDSHRDASEHGLAYKKVLDEIKLRDRRDKARSVAPLVQARDAIAVDTTHLSINQVVVQILHHIARLAAQRRNNFRRSGLRQSRLCR
ncbi:MAG: (d)CMP kinase [Planctomycetes bacterium]|nr:(d)CMP kinase [Planctomycetota bacterium]